MTTDDPMDRLRGTVPDDHRMPPARADRLEVALRVAHAEQASTAARPLWWRPVGAVAVALVIVIAAVATLIVRDTAPSAALVMSDASGVTVRLPDGSEVVDPADGFELPDGAVVSIADGGTATIDDTTIDVAGVLEVRDGSLVSRVDVTTTMPPITDQAPAPSTPDDATTTTIPPVVDRGSSTTLPPIEAPPVDDQPTDRSNATSTTTSTTTLPNQGADDERGRPEPAPVAAIDIGLRIEPADGGLRIRWRVTPLHDGWEVVIQRQIGDGDRTVVSGPSASAEGEIVDVPDVPLAGDGPRVRYRVAVLDEAGGLVGAGPFQSVRR